MTNEEIIEVWEAFGPALNENGKSIVPRFARMVAAKQIEDYTTDELLDELKRRMK
jgi:hypothetical protein